MCRRPFSREIFKQSKHHGSSSSKTIGNPQDICWFYEGKCGWWKFDERNGEDIEQSFNTGVEKFQLLLCGKLYVIDFKNMIQYRVDGSGRVRCIKRDSASSSSKGIAGLTNKNWRTGTKFKVNSEFMWYYAMSILPLSINKEYFHCCLWHGAVNIAVDGAASFLET